MASPRQSVFAVWRWPRSRVEFLLIMFLGADVVFAAYFATYLRLLAGTAIHVKIAESRLAKTVKKVPTYSGANSPIGRAIQMDKLLEPAHQFDRMIRPVKWPKPKTVPHSDDNPPSDAIEFEDF